MHVHDHLDRRIRPRGSGCPGCDQFWADQDGILVDRIRRGHLEREIILAVNRRPGRNHIRWCRALADVDGHTHTCGHPAGHDGDHWCAVCATPHPW